MTEYAAILGTLAGVVVGGLVNFFASRTVKQQEWRLALARDQINRRQELYAEYLAEVQRLTAQSIYKELDVPKDVQTLDRLLAQMTLLSPEPVIEAAKQLRRHVLRISSATDQSGDDKPSFNRLSQTFVDSARSDIRVYSDDA